MGIKYNHAGRQDIPECHITKIGPEPVHGVQSSPLCGANHECATGGLDYILCNDTQCVDTQDPLNLHKQPVEQPEVATGDAADGGNGLRVRKVSTVEGQAKSLNFSHFVEDQNDPST